MALIKGGTSGVELEIDALPKAARGILYKADGTSLYPVNTGSYITRFEIVPTTLLTTTAYWHIRNLDSTKSMFIRSLDMKLGFSGTAAATRSLYELTRTGAATPTGGTNVTPTKMLTTMPASIATDNRFAPGGLTMTSVTFGDPIHLFGNTNQLSADHEHALRFERENPLILLPNEGLVIRANGAVVLGSYVIGSIRWDER